jgi:hypothetical protein
VKVERDTALESLGEYREQFNRWSETEGPAHLERVKAELVEARIVRAGSVLVPRERAEQAEARLDKALAALREIAKNKGHMPGVSQDAVVARAAIAEIEGEA